MTKSFSSHYRFMCKAAEEIQKLWRDTLWQYGDFYCGTNSVSKDRPVLEVTHGDDVIHGIWVPSEEQLGRRFFPDPYEAKLSGGGRYERWLEEHAELVEKVNKMGSEDDALALMYVMDTRFDKEWDWEAYWIPIK